MSRLSGSRAGVGSPAPARRAISSAAAIVLTLAIAGTALAASVANGGFETGDFTGWTVASATADGSWYVYEGTQAPVVGMAVPAPPEGTYAAMSDASDVGVEVLYQDLVLPADYHGSLTFTWYYVNRALGGFADPASLDYRVEPNQQYRIDLVDPAADPFSVASGDVLASIAGTHPGDAASLAPTAVTFDLTPFAGRTVRLRFAAVQNQGYFEGGADAVSISSAPVEPPPPPPPATPTTPDDCKLGGWQGFVDGQGNAFRNQGDCVSWILAMGPGSLSRPTR